jgi:predicted transcriptional regulator
MKTKTQAPDANEFCLVLTPTVGAPLRASEAIRQRFDVLADEIRRELAAIVGQLVEDSVERRPRKPITVTVMLGAAAIRGEVSDQGNLVPFEIPLPRPA